MMPTETLRAMLDERGVEWETDRSGFRVMWGKPVDEFHDTMQFKAVDNALPNGGLNVHICGFTPEQAIAATLGRGTLSASQVSNAVYAHSIHADCADADWQAIADELNNALGSFNCTNSERTNAACKPITYDNGYSMDRLEPGEYHEFWEPACACGNCGELIPMRKFCPNCGSRLEVDE